MSLLIAAGKSKWTKVARAVLANSRSRDSITSGIGQTAAAATSGTSSSGSSASTPPLPPLSYGETINRGLASVLLHTVY